MYAAADPILRRVQLRVDATVAEAIRKSGLLEECPGLELGRHRVGIFGRLVSLGDAVKPADRVEIYDPLPRDPKETRRQRARLKKSARKYAGVSGAGSPLSSRVFHP